MYPGPKRNSGEGRLAVRVDAVRCGGVPCGESGAGLGVGVGEAAVGIALGTALARRACVRGVVTGRAFQGSRAAAGFVRSGVRSHA